MARLKRMILKGPKGPLRDMGQGSLDKAHKAARSYLSRHAGAGHGNIGDISGPLQGIAKRMVVDRWGKAQWPFFNDLVNRESGWDPTAVNPSSGAAGLAQALPPSKYPAGAWPYTGKSSAVKQLQWMVQYVAERYGTPAGAIDWHNSHNWYQQGGMVGFQKGGGAKGKQSTFSNIGSFRERLRKLARKIGKTDERIGIAQSLASLDASPGGSGLSAAEKSTQLGLLGTLQGQLTKQQQLALSGLSLSKQIKSSPSFFRDILTETQGLTGKGGRLFDTSLAIKELQGTSLAGSLGISIADLLRIRDASQIGLLNNLPTAHTGGIVPGPVGSPQPIMALGGETVNPVGGAQYFDIYIGGEKIAEHVRAELRTADRATNLRARAGVRR